METAVRILKEQVGTVVESVRENEMIITNQGTDEQISALIGCLIQNQVVLTGFYREEGSLESLFMQLTEVADNEGAMESNREERFTDSSAQHAYQLGTVCL